MEIVWYGQSCFRIRGRGCSLVTDPYGPDLGPALPRLTTNVVTVSYDDEEHNYVRALRGRPYVVSGPGEYEVSGIFVLGVQTYRDAKDGQERGKNTAYVIELEEMTICHLGDLGHVPSQEQVELLNDIDVLLIPVGGHGALTGSRAAEVVNMLDPRIVIPMRYKVPGIHSELDTVTRFLNEMAVEKPEKQESLDVTKTQLPEPTQVVVLEPSLAS